MPRRIAIALAIGVATFWAPLSIAAPTIPGAWRFLSAARLQPVRVRVSVGPASPGYLFVAPIGNVTVRRPFLGQHGPLILDRAGRPVWVHPLPRPQVAMGFSEQTYRGAPVLTWWQGVLQPDGVGSGVGVIMNDHYQVVATVRPGRGLSMDPHEFLITPSGTALFIATHRVPRNLARLGGERQGTVLDPVVEEEGIVSRRVVWRWDALRHVSLSESYTPPAGTGPWDAFHFNSVATDGAGEVLVSSRDTSSLFAVSRRTGAIRWRLGGKRSTFRFGPQARFAGQHDARFGPAGTITLFDNHVRPGVSGPPRGLVLALDTARRTARLVRQFVHPRPSLSAPSQGNLEPLPDGGAFVGWGAAPYTSEFDRNGRLVFDMRFPGRDESYRAYLLDWTGRPLAAPSIAVLARGRRVRFFASWNGATGVSAWRLLCGPSRRSLEPREQVRRGGFETTIDSASCRRYAAVVALDASGRILGRSRTIDR